MRSLGNIALVSSVMLLPLWQPALANPPDYYPSDYSEIIEASKSESGVLIYSNIALINWDPIIAAFNAEYPWIKVEGTDLGGNEVFERYYADQGAGARSADILLAAAPAAWLGLLPRDLIVDYKSPEIPKLPEWSMPRPGVYTISTEPFVLAFNKLLLPEEEWPSSMQDVVDLVAKDPDQWQSRLGTYSPNATAFTQAIFYTMYKLKGDQAIDWFNQIGKYSDIYEGAGPIIEKVISGEYQIGYLVASQTVQGLYADPAREQLIGWSLPEDATVVNMRNFAIMKSSNSPNSAKLLLDFILSKAGQTAVGIGGLVPYRADVDDPAAMPGGLTYSNILAQVGEENVGFVSLDAEMPEAMTELAPRLDAAFAK